MSGWSTDPPWFDVALVGTGFAIGSILFGRFEENRPRWRRLVKFDLGLVRKSRLSSAIRGRCSQGESRSD